jgi:hypothetical protein
MEDLTLCHHGFLRLGLAGFYADIHLVQCLRSVARRLT